MKFYRIPTALIVAAATTPCACFAQSAADFPNKAVRVVIAQPPGGAIDIQARLFTAKMSENLHQQFIVDNRGGSAGVAGITAFTTVINAVPDGYTLLAVNPDFTFAPALYKKYPIDPIKDFAPVSLATRAPYLLVVNASTSTKSVKDLIALAHAQPGKLNFGAGNIGAGTHLSTMWFISAAKINAVYVPYKGTGPALTDLMGGRIDASLTNVLSSGPHVKSGKLRAVGISTAQRSKVLPDVPTIQEQGVPGYNAYTFHGYLAPAGTPVAIINKLSSEFARVVKAPEMADKLSSDGGEPVGSTADQFRQAITTEVVRWRKLVKDLNIQAPE